jgi:hypothetical protein
MSYAADRKERRAPKEVHPERFPGKTGLLKNSSFRKNSRMQLKTILNRIEPHKSFAYGPVKMLED